MLNSVNKLYSGFMDWLLTVEQEIIVRLSHPKKKPGTKWRRLGRCVYWSCCCCVFYFCCSCCSSFCIDSSCKWLFCCFTFFETFFSYGAVQKLSTKIFMIITTVLVTRFRIKWFKGYMIYNLYRCWWRVLKIKCWWQIGHQFLCHQQA